MEGLDINQDRIFNIKTGIWILDFLVNVFKIRSFEEMIVKFWNLQLKENSAMFLGMHKEEKRGVPKSRHGRQGETATPEPDEEELPAEVIVRFFLENLERNFSKKKSINFREIEPPTTTRKRREKYRIWYSTWYEFLKNPKIENIRIEMW